MDELLKSDVDRLKEHLKKLGEPDLDEDSKIETLDEMEMLVESIDNANALASIQGVPQVLKLFNDESDEVKMQAVWVIGTCVQNNARFTEHLLKDGGFDALVALLDTSSSASVLSRVVYAISGAVRASQLAVAKAITINAFQKLIALFSKESSDLNLKRKIVFLFSGVLYEHHSIPNLIDFLVESQMYETFTAALKLNDWDLTEKIFEVYEASFSASPAAVNHIKNSSLHKDIAEWTKTAQVPAENKPTIAKTLSFVGIAYK